MVIHTGRSSATQNLAPADGTYVLGGTKYRVRRGNPLPPGAAFTPAAPPATPTGPQAPDAQRASAALGEGYAAALQAAGYALVKEADVQPGELIEFSPEEEGERLAELLKAAGYELKPAKAKKSDAQPKEDAGTGETAGPAENADGAGPRETT